MPTTKRVAIAISDLVKLTGLGADQVEKRPIAIHYKGVQPGDAQSSEARADAMRPDGVVVFELTFDKNADTESTASSSRALHDATKEDPAIVQVAMEGNTGGQLTPETDGPSYTPTSPKYGTFTDKNPDELDGAVDSLRGLDKKRKAEDLTPPEKKAKKAKGWPGSEQIDGRSYVGEITISGQRLVPVVSRMVNFPVVKSFPKQRPIKCELCCLPTRADRKVKPTPNDATLAKIVNVSGIFFVCADCDKDGLYAVDRVMCIDCSAPLPEYIKEVAAFTSTVKKAKTEDEEEVAASSATAVAPQFSAGCNSGE